MLGPNHAMQSPSCSTSVQMPDGLHGFSSHHMHDACLLVIENVLWHVYELSRYMIYSTTQQSLHVASPART